MDNLINNQISMEEKFMARQYWKSIVEYKCDNPGIQWDFIAQSQTEPIYDDIPILFTQKSYESLKAITKDNDIILFIYLLGILNTLFYKYTRHETFIIGSPVFNNNGVNRNSITAYKLQISKHLKFRDVLNNVKSTVMDVLKYQSCSFEEAYKSFSKSTDDNLLLPVMVYYDQVHQNIDIDEFLLHYKSKILFIFKKENNKISSCIRYDTNVYKSSTIEQASKIFTNIILQVITDADILVKDIQLISKEECQAFLNIEKSPQFPQDKTLHQLFEAQVDKTPDATAVVCGDEKLTYRQLEQKANQIANYLRQKYTIEPDTLVGVMMNKDIDLIPALLGVLKAGGAYVPLNPEYPLKHLQGIINDANLEIIITKNEYATQQLKDSCPTLKKFFLIDDSGIPFDKIQDNRLESVSKPYNLAYVIYTSGTTGKSNGVAIEHRNVVSLMMDKRLPFEFNSNDVWSMSHSICFDFSVWEMYGALLYGGKLVLIPGNIARDVNKFLQVIKKEKVTVLSQTPSAFYPLMQKELEYRRSDLALRYVIFGGESLNMGLLRQWTDKYPETKMVNMYGITETTVVNTFKFINKEDIDANISNIGRMLATSNGYIMNEDMNLLPVGMIGELYISGYGLGRSYLNNDELTNKRFVTSPYNDYERLYKTGDLVRYLPNGDMEYCGRIDHQVKVRGFRIDLSQIENNLYEYPGITQAVVIADQSEGNEQYLYAYYVADVKISATELRHFLSSRIADYMIPSFFIQLDEIPINQNGKVNRNLLPKFQEIQSCEEFTEPCNQIEQMLAEIWCKVLNIQKVGTNQNFFEIGGHSLRAVMLEVELQKKNIPADYADIYTYKTIKEYAKYLESKGYKCD